MEEGRARGHAEAHRVELESLIGILTSILPDFDDIYEKIVLDEKYKGVSVKKY